MLKVGSLSERQLHRTLDVTGDGTGSTNAALDFSSTPGVFKVVPGAAEVFEIDTLTVLIADNASFAAGDYGGINGGVTIGVKLELMDGGGVIYKIFGNPKTNAQFIAASDSRDYFSFSGAGDDILMMEIGFTRGGKNALRLDGSDGVFLSVTLNDDFSGLTAHIFHVHGHVATILE